MGLDIVEIVMRSEEEFTIKLENYKLERMYTVGDLFELICEQLKLPSDTKAPETFISTRGVPKDGWTRESAWSRLVAVISHQLQVERDEVRYSASFVNDLGAD